MTGTLMCEIRNLKSKYDVAVEKSTATTQQATGEIRHLLYFLDLLNQALQVKMDTLFCLPSFLHNALDRVRSRHTTAQLTSAAEEVTYHVKTLRRIILDLGGRVEQDIVEPEKAVSGDMIATVAFQESLATQILEEAIGRIAHDWQSSPLRQWIEEQLQTLAKESAAHEALVEKLFTATQPRYRDLVLERFRITAVS